MTSHPCLLKSHGSRRFNHQRCCITRKNQMLQSSSYFEGTNRKLSFDSPTLAPEMPLPRATTPTLSAQEAKPLQTSTKPKSEAPVLSSYKNPPAIKSAANVKAEKPSIAPVPRQTLLCLLFLKRPMLSVLRRNSTSPLLYNQLRHGSSWHSRQVGKGKGRGLVLTGEASGKQV